MNQEDIMRIETELGIELPESYSQIVLNNPLSKPGYEIVSPMLIDDPKQIIDVNQDLRNNGFQGQEWPKYFLVIGVGRKMTGYYFINTRAKNEKIYLADEEKKYNPKSIARLSMKDNFKEYIELAEMLQSVNV